MQEEEHRQSATLQQAVSLVRDARDSTNRDSERKSVIVKDLANQVTKFLCSLFVILYSFLFLYEISLFFFPPGAQTERTEIVETFKERLERSEHVEYAAQLTLHVEQLVLRRTLQLHEASLECSRSMQAVCNAVAPALAVDVPRQILESISGAVARGYEGASSDTKSTIERLRALRKETFYEAKRKEAEALEKRAKRIAEGKNPGIEIIPMPERYEDWKLRWKGKQDEEEVMAMMSTNFGQFAGFWIEDDDDGRGNDASGNVGGGGGNDGSGGGVRSNDSCPMSADRNRHSLIRCAACESTLIDCVAKRQQRRQQSESKKVARKRAKKARKYRTSNNRYRRKTLFDGQTRLRWRLFRAYATVTGATMRLRVAAWRRAACSFRSAGTAPNGTWRIVWRTSGDATTPTTARRRRRSTTCRRTTSSCCCASRIGWSTSIWRRGAWTAPTVRCR
ncbi:MAG: hypothetical protein IPK82_23230 [Polyangiaceae bacterium]|nr:hypothetical protein [Polyangiaceae bacterium]